MKLNKRIGKLRQIKVFGEEEERKSEVEQLQKERIALDAELKSLKRI